MNNIKICSKKEERISDLRFPPEHYCVLETLFDV